MIDDLYQTGTDAALDDRVARAAPPKPAEPGGFSFWSTVGAGFRGFGATLHGFGVLSGGVERGKERGDG